MNIRDGQERKEIQTLLLFWMHVALIPLDEMLTTVESAVAE